MKSKNIEKLQLLSDLLKKRSELVQKKEKIVSDLFKCESAYLETTQGLPITTTSEYYVNNRVDKKKYHVQDKDRIFSKEYPKKSS